MRNSASLARKQKQQQRHYCREDLCIFTQQVLESYFPVDPLSHPSSHPKLSIWLSYVLYRTTIPDNQVFFALHLLRRVSEAYAPRETSTSTHPLFHHQLLLSALILSGVYFCDHTYTNGSWRTASMSLWTVKEIDELEFELFRVLEFRLREEGEELEEVVKEYQTVFEGEKRKCMERMKYARVEVKRMGLNDKMERYTPATALVY